MIHGEPLDRHYDRWREDQRAPAYGIGYPQWTPAPRNPTLPRWWGWYTWWPVAGERTPVGIPGEAAFNERAYGVDRRRKG